MYRLKAASSFLRRSSKESYTRTFTSLASSNPLFTDHENLVLVEANAALRTAVLNRPQSLNALNTSMGYRLQNLYKNWEDDPDVAFVAMKGSGRAFCAGGDLVSLFRMIQQASVEECKELIRTLYSFMYMLGTYSKPNVALLNGITMGSGAGVSIPATFRVATDKTVFAMPECRIGFHPDAGASFHLSRLPGYLGEYLGLTGDGLNGVEMLSCGLATHYSRASKLPLIEEQLATLLTDDPSVVNDSLQNFGDIAPPDHTSVIHWTKTLDKCFCHETVEEIVDALETEAGKTQDPWCVSALKKLKEASPLSLKVALRSIREGRFQTLDQCFIREYRMSVQGVSGKITSDFQEGIRARLVEKDHTPMWDPPSLELVTKDMVDEYFAPISALEPDLELPTKQQEAFV